MISIHIDWSSRDRPQQTQKQTDVYIQHIITKSEKERDRSHSRKGTCSVSFRAIFVCLFFYCLLKITSAALISLYWHSDIQGAKRLLPWVVTYWRHCCPLNLRPLLLRNFGPKNNVLQKTSFSQVESSLALGSPGCLFVWLSPCQKWPNTQENGF